MTALLELNGVWAGYGGSDVLRDLSSPSRPAAITCVVGPNGAGKSTILRVVSGQVARGWAPSPSTASRSVGATRGRSCGLGIVQVAQSHSLFPDMTVRENVEMGGFLIGTARRWSSA